MSKQTAVEWLYEQISNSICYYRLIEDIESKSTIRNPKNIFQQAKEMEDEQLLEYWKGGQASEQEGGVSFDVYHNGDDLTSTDMAAMYKQILLLLKMEVNVPETQKYYKSKEVQDLDNSTDVVDEYEKIELTPDELLNLLKEAYRNGYATYELVDAGLEHYDADGYARWVLLGLK